LYRLEVIAESGIVKPDGISALVGEADELVAIFTATGRSTRAGRKIRNPKLTMEPKITQDMTIRDVLHRFPHLFGVFEDHGLHFCAGCYVMLASTIGEGANYSGLKPADRQALLAELNRLAPAGVQEAASAPPATP
jgi:hypothetical protein